MENWSGINKGMQQFSKIIQYIRWIAGSLFILLVLTCQNTDEREENSPVSVVQYSGDEVLTREDSWMTDWNGDTLYWNGSIENEKVDININGLCGDECSWVYSLAMSERSNDLPVFNVFKHTETELVVYQQTIDCLETGTIEIQDWNNENVYSGKITGIMSSADSVEIVFWWENKTIMRSPP